MAERTTYIEVVPYDPLWKKEFAVIAAAVESWIGDLLIAVEHVGSTSVEGLAAKPIIDLDAVMRSSDDLPEIVERLGRQGFEYQGNLGIEGREAFRPTRDFGFMNYHLYVCPPDGRGYLEHIALRDYLRTHDGARDEYARLKRALADRHRTDIDAYVEGKTAFVREILRRAGR
ncbi:GrpB family protein [Saccharibacillus alkalitolerans]|uniref:GrpB family protein n=1 Tax=Saccharibacillus alkalitolerans TaxID=2705290 RepID=A0ABX0FEC1_9BACL|nr:GrpB family protein [Saccharibacillus alkalitolerans]NGZ77622.1 GrpB family protein [Saccharibacillus alkalitolerans]